MCVVLYAVLCCAISGSKGGRYPSRYTVVKGNSLHLVEGPNCSWFSTYTPALTPSEAPLVGKQKKKITACCFNCFRIDAAFPLT